MGFQKPPQQPDFAQLRTTLAQIDRKDNALYQTIKLLIDWLTQFQGITVSDIADINASINAILSITNISADKLRTYITVNDESIKLPNSRQLLSGTGINFDDTVPNKRTVNAINSPLTINNEFGAFPNSRQLLAGTNITFDDTVAGKRTINASGGGGTGAYYDSPLSDGDEIEAHLIFGNGDPIICQVPNVP